MQYYIIAWIILRIAMIPCIYTVKFNVSTEVNVIVYIKKVAQLNFLLPITMYMDQYYTQVWISWSTM